MMRGEKMIYGEKELAAGKAAYEHWLKTMSERGMTKEDTPEHLKPPTWDRAQGAVKELFILGAIGAIKWQNEMEDPEVDKW
jgi:hypothetical protein